MIIDSTKLQSVSTFADKKNITRQHVYRLIKTEEINSVTIDGVIFVILDEKSRDFKRKRSKS